MRILAELIESAGQGVYPCLFHVVTGAYCPGCGGTRAFLALLHGRVADSIRLNPLVLYMAVSIPSFLLYRFYCIRKKKAPRSAVWMTALFIGIAVLAVNFFVKNYYLLVRHVDLLAGIY